MKLSTLLLLAASLQAQTGDSFLLCLFVAVVIMCEGAALLWGPRWLKWTITVIAAFITLAMLGVCIAYGQTVKPAMPNTHPLMTTDFSCPDGGRLAHVYTPQQTYGVFNDVPPETVTVGGNTYEYEPPLTIHGEPPPVCIFSVKAAAPMAFEWSQGVPAPEKAAPPVTPNSSPACANLCADYPPTPPVIMQTTPDCPVNAPNCTPVPAPAKPDDSIAIYTLPPPTPGCSVMPGDELHGNWCVSHIVLGMPGHCTITRSYGEQRLTCWYRPIPKPSGGAKP